MIRRAFTLIEMMVVITIIVILAGLTLGISNSVLRGAEIRQVKDTLTLLEMAMEEWELAATRQMTYGAIDEPNGILTYSYDIPEPTSLNEQAGLSMAFIPDDEPDDANEVMRNAIDRMMAVPESRAIIERIDPDFFRPEEGQLENWIWDPWDTRVLLVPAGRDFNPAFDRIASGMPEESQWQADRRDPSGDGTVRNSLENAFGGAANARPYFVSAGPDGRWGHRQLKTVYADMPLDGDEAELAAEATDNVTSYEVYLDG